MKAPLEWLMDSEPWIQYRTRLDLLRQSEHDSEVQAAHSAMLSNDQVQCLIKELSNWPGVVISSHKSAGQLVERLTFLADLGLTAKDPGMTLIMERILEHQSIEGPFQLPVNIPEHYGGSGKDSWAWALCDAPLILYALAKFGLSEYPAVKNAAGFLVGLIRENGWPCAVSKELGKFHGPGKKSDPCPYANLAMLKALSEMAEYRDSQACHIGAETLLNCWDESAASHPYMFFMGTDFRKLKVPFVWYDLIHVLDVLSKFVWIKEDARFRDMFYILKNKADPDGRYTLESTWTAWKEWEFGQKQEPSRWLTLAAWRIINRVES